MTGISSEKLNDVISDNDGIGIILDLYNDTYVIYTYYRNNTNYDCKKSLCRIKKDFGTSLIELYFKNKKFDTLDLLNELSLIEYNNSIDVIKIKKRNNLFRIIRGMEKIEAGDSK